jgi:FlaA1/EpsC-like NDP-sugar epimerase
MLQHQRSILFLGDVISLILAFMVMIFIRFNIRTQQLFIVQQAHLFAWVFIIWLIVFFVFDLYNLRRVNPNPRNVGLLVASTITNVVLGIVYFYIFSKSGITPKTNLLLVGLFSFILLVIWRRLFYHLFTVRFTRTIATVGTSPLIAELQTELKKNPHFGAHVVHWDTITAAGTAHGHHIDILIAEQSDPQQLLGVSKILQAETLTLIESYETFFTKIPLSLITDERAVAIRPGASTRRCISSLAF